MREDTIIFWHRGNSWYLKVALEQAAKCNDNVVLLGDEKNANTWDNYYNMDELPDERYQKFRKVYKNLSLNDEVFELRCFERYFYVLEYCKQMKLDRIILCDSDLLIYQNLTQYFDGKMRAFSHTLSEPEGMAISPHCSLWSLGDLEQFVNFLIDYYYSDIKYLEDVFTKYKASHNKGGICDMTLLWLWLNKYHLPYFNTAIMQGGIVDHAISVPDNGKRNEYVVSKLTGCKVVKFKNGMPYFRTRKNGEDVLVVALHCSGGYKNYMSYFSLEKSNTVNLFVHRFLLKIRGKM